MSDAKFVAKERDFIREVIQSLDHGDEITWWDEADRCDNQSVTNTYRNGVGIGDPTGQKNMYISNDGWISEIEKHSDSLPAHGMTLTRLVVWDD